jgi:spermidine synthase
MQTDPARTSDKLHFVLACTVLGFSSMVAQIVLFREMMVSFYGNELTLGVMLSVWLFWVGVGSALGNRISGGKVYSPGKLSFWYLVISVALPLTIILVRFSKQILGTVPAEVIGFFPMLFFAFAAMSLFCLVMGIAFVLNSKSWRFDEGLVFAVNRVYMWESLGAAWGGVLVTFVLIPNFSNFKITHLLVCLNLVLFVFLLAGGLKRWIKGSLWAVVILAAGASFIWNLDESLDRYSVGKVWRDLPLVYSKDTRYGNISVTRQHEQVTFYQNGLMLFSYPDDFSAEEAVHFALLEHPNPRALLLIGGGVGGALSQALKYDGLEIDYAEIDPELIRTAREHLPESEIQALSDPRVHVHFLDGRLLVRKKWMEKGGRRYDVVVMNLPDPNTAQLNRLYTAEFFRMVKSAMNQGGVFSFRVSSAENYISRELSLYLSSVHRTLKSAFEEVRVLPGANNVFLASNKENVLFGDWQTFAARLSSRGISTRFVNENFLPDRLSSPRVGMLKDALSQEQARTNSDLEPICYFYNGILWSKQFKSLEKPLLLYLSGVGPAWLVGAVVLAFCLAFALCGLPASRHPRVALAAIFVAGFSTMFAEIIVVLSFQTFHGYIYSMIGLIFTLFMLGLFLGAGVIQKIALRRGVSFRGLAAIQLFQVVFILLLLAAISTLAKASISDPVMQSVLFLLIAVSGLLGGMLFASANHLFLGSRTTLKAGTGYSVDLFGAGLGSLLASAILIPLLGIPATLVMLLLVNIVCLCALLFLLRASGVS